MRTLTPHQALLLSILAALTTIGMKAGAWWLTGSVGFLSDALESLVNLAGASFALLMVSLARAPADPEHPYGHGKAEYFSAAFEGMLIFVAALVILAMAVERLIHPQPLGALGLGTVLSVGASLVNLAVARILFDVGRAHRSLALEADARHLMTDVWTTAGVVTGVGLASLSGWNWLDPLVAAGVALNILREGWSLMHRSVDGLMDRALDDAEIRHIEAVLQSCCNGGGCFVNLKTRVAGAMQFAHVDLRVPGNWTVAHAHALADAAERAVHKQTGTRLTTHIEPTE
ncbi:cation diffusion facilitator family transporter [Aromatoleum bremense]|uniref:Cation diffusion facilitator family transporter n=1 Tax=Aromatoleum bremense TaxID=76115 RepID=A0ABX1NRB6_9RHOO|nr:cation diffusion facilitator family transporter [Aromatoleum bremense]NMG14545.1 cation diffusion facilitator family transporter [Aromatoleum bremense]